MANEIEQLQSRVNTEAESSPAEGVRRQHIGGILQRELNWLDDVESVFLRSARENPRSPGALHDWLGHCEKMFEIAVQHREFAEETMRKYGPDASAIG